MLRTSCISLANTAGSGDGKIHTSQAPSVKIPNLVEEYVPIRTTNRHNRFNPPDSRYGEKPAGKFGGHLTAYGKTPGLRPYTIGRTILRWPIFSVRKTKRLALMDSSRTLRATVRYGASHSRTRHNPGVLMWMTPLPSGFYCQK